MPARQLPLEIVSLIHHVELNRSGWWKKAVSQIVQGILWKSDAPMSTADIVGALKADLGINMTEALVVSQLALLEDQAAVSKIAGRFKLTETKRTSLSGLRGAAVAEEVECKRAFIDLCVTRVADLNAEDAWTRFSIALQKAIRVTGANLFHLIADGNLETEQDWLTAFLMSFPAGQREALKGVIQSFFSNANPSCRHQVLRLLTAHFFAEASQLRPETLSSLEGGEKKKSIKVILDTNFIFSVLQLHDNPGDDAAESLIELARKNEKFLQIKMYVLPSTLEEARRVLVNQEHNIERVRATPAIARAAVTQPLPSIARKFFDAASKSPGLTAGAFFAPYIDDLKTILEGKGIKVLDANPATYRMRQDVLDDVADEQAREIRDLPELRRKGYETLIHDAIVWHVVQDRRGAEIDSPFDADYWAITMDWRLVAFDKRKRQQSQSRLPLILHPTNFVQLVQFWLPRSDELDDSLIDSIRLPLFFHSFDQEDEKATLSILSAISRYENVDDLPEITLKHVLANQALRGKIFDGEAANEKIFQLVKEEIISEHKQAVGELGVTKQELLAAQSKLEEERLQKLESLTDLDKTNQMLLAAETRAARSEVRAEAEMGSRHRLVYSAVFLLVPAIVGILLAFYSYQKFSLLFPANTSNSVKWPVILGLGFVPFAIACVASPIVSRKYQHISSWMPARVLNYVGVKGVIAPLLFALAAIFQGGIWDWFKSISGIQF